MSTLKTHYGSSLIPVEGKYDPNRTHTFQAGEMVQDMFKNVGIVVEVLGGDLNGDRYKVLWGEGYRDIWDQDVEVNFRPVPVNLNYTQIAKDLVPIQPMPLPNGLVFYLDKMTEKKGEEDKT